MILYFIRHAQSSNNHLYETTGASVGRSEDPVLTNLGRNQAEALAKFLKYGDPNGGNNHKGINGPGFGIKIIYCSLMIRSMETGIILADRLNVPLNALIDLHECGGVYLDDLESGLPVGLPGKELTFFQDNYPSCGLPEDINPTGWWNKPFESQPERFQRAYRLKSYLLDLHGESREPVALVSHGSFFNYFVRALVGQNVDLGDVWFRLNNTGIARFDLDQRMEISYINRLDHLPPEYITE